MVNLFQKELPIPFNAEELFQGLQPNILSRTPA